MRNTKSFNHFASHTPTREEEYVKYYLESHRISYQEQLILKDLKWDIKRERRVDFYLDKMDVYLEYYGLYNSTKDKRDQYDKKTAVYFKNNLPTIILYPHELGFLDYAFHTKILKLSKLEKFRYNKKRFYRYMFSRYYNRGKWKHLFSAIFWFYLFYVFAEGLVNIDEGLEAIFFFVSMFIFSYFLSSFILDLVYFIRQKGVLE